MSTIDCSAVAIIRMIINRSDDVELKKNCIFKVYDTYTSIFNEETKYNCAKELIFLVGEIKGEGKGI